MQIQSILLCFFLSICHLSHLSVYADASKNSLVQTTLNDGYIHALASLVFHTQTLEKQLDSDFSLAEDMIFSADDAALLWAKARHILSLCATNSNLIHHLYFLEDALKQYEHANDCMQAGNLQEAQKGLQASFRLLRQLWEEAIELEENLSSDFLISAIVRKKADPNFEDNPHIPSTARKMMKPYLLPLNHPKRSVLDAIFLKKRVTTDRESFYQAGFKTIAKGPRSYVRVAKHAKLSGYLVKAYLDTVLEKKYNKESWEWLVRRCEGASKIRSIIRKYKIQHFTVPDKWIYCLPADPSPPNDAQHTRHLALLLVTNMNLASKSRNYHAWLHYITKEHLDELYMILSRAKGSSYRPDNIAYTNLGKFAFIDTEYPSKGPDFSSIRSYLNQEMLNYWDNLVKQGGYSS